MPRIAKQSKNDIADALAVFFGEYGYEGTSLAMLASASGLSKASLYHHFPRGKQDMAAYVLGRAGVRLQKLILAPLQAKGAGRDRLLNSLEGTAAYYDGDVPICLMNSLMIGEGRHLFGEQIKQAVNMWQGTLAKAYGDVTEEADVDCEAWACAAIESIQGALVRCRLVQARSPLESCLKGLRQKTIGNVDNFT